MRASKWKKARERRKRSRTSWLNCARMAIYYRIWLKVHRLLKELHGTYSCNLCPSFTTYRSMDIHIVTSNFRTSCLIRSIIWKWLILVWQLKNQVTKVKLNFARKRSVRRVTWHPKCGKVCIMATKQIFSQRLSCFSVCTLANLRSISRDLKIPNTICSWQREPTIIGNIISRINTALCSQTLLKTSWLECCRQMSINV